MIIITANWKAKAGKESELKKHLETMVENVRENEIDCLEYILQEKRGDASSFLFYEQYKDMAAIDLHKQTPHFKALIRDTADLIEEEVKVELFDLVV